MADWGLTRAAMIATVVVLVASCTGTTPADDAPSPSDALELAVPRAVHKATVLDDGRVLLTGGCTLPGCGGFDQGRVSEIFDPATERTTEGPEMTTPRAGHTATKLADGRVLLVGGYPGEGRPAQASAEVFDPDVGTFRPVGDLDVARADHTATLLPDGAVLIAGGTTGAGDPLSSTELFDPRGDTFHPGPPLSGPRAGHSAAVTQGRPILVGGTADAESALATTDVLGDGGWAPGPTLGEARVKHAVSTLPDGTVLVIGGASTIEGRELLATTEILDVDAGRSRPGPALSEGQYKLEGGVASLPDGRLVIAGGRRVDVYDPRTGEMSVLTAPPVPRRSFLSVSVVADTTVLIAGGYDSDIAPTTEARIVRVE